MLDETISLLTIPILIGLAFLLNAIIDKYDKKGKFEKFLSKIAPKNRAHE